MSIQPTPPHFAHLRNQYVTIVAFGDSNTEFNHTALGGLNWVGLLSLGLIDKKVFPKGYVVINTGISGDSVGGGLKRLQRDVLRFDPQIVIVGFGGNDASQVRPDEYRAQLRNLVRRLRTESRATVVLRTPLPMIDMHTGHELLAWVDQKGVVLRQGIRDFVRVTREVAKTEGALLVDHYSSWIRSSRTSCHGDVIRLMSDHLHPNHFGHRRLYHEIAPVFHANRYLYYEWERVFAHQRGEPERLILPRRQTDEPPSGRPRGRSGK